MLNLIKGAKACRNTVKNLSGLFGCSKDFVRLYYQSASAEQCMSIMAMRASLIDSCDTF